ncbi:uncharacterized protein V2V93DRAFT_367802 [Kockiozyma suomiensis]|uniref:uncharacterized protein n=1 Tax=Kockiozyma suomiensis TaxID=1337062 RepID=UPI003343420F
MANIFTYEERPASLLSPFLSSSPLDCSFKYGGIEPETDSHGAIEYKLHMLNPQPSRLAQLTTQLQWRLTQGQGQAIYEIGVSDDGTLVGLLDAEIYASLRTLKAMARAVGAWFKVARVIPVHGSEAVDSPNVRTRRRVVEVHIFKTAPERDVARVFFVGGSNTGKSSLLGKICYDTHDNGRGKARMKVLKHRHELVSGKTSSIGIDVFGYNPAPPFMGMRRSVESMDSIDSSSGREIIEDYDARYTETQHGRQSVVVSNYTNKYTHEEIVASSQRVVMTFDTPGTRSKLGLLCRSLALYSPDVTIVTVAGSGSSRWAEYLDLALRATSRVAILLTKCDTFTSTEHLRAILHDILLRIASFRRTSLGENVECGDETDDRTLFGKMVNSADTAIDCAASDLCVPVFLVSAVSGTGVPFLHEFLNVVEVANRVTLPKENSSSKRAAAEKKQNETIEDISSLEAATAEVAYDHLLHHTSNCDCTANTAAAARASASSVRHVSIGSEDDESNFFVTSVYDSGRILTGVVRSGTLKLGRTYYLGFAGMTSSSVSSSDESVSSASTHCSSNRKLVRIIVRSMQKLRVPCLQLREGEIGSIGIEIVGASSMTTPALLESDFRVRRHMSVVSARKMATDGAAMTGVELELCVPRVLKPGDTAIIYNGFERSGEVLAGGLCGRIVLRFFGLRGEFVAEGQRVIVDIHGEKIMARIVRSVLV